MSTTQLLLASFLLTLVTCVPIDLCSNGKVCGHYPQTFCCPTNVQCGTSVGRHCLTESKGPTATGIIFITVMSLFICIMVLKACMTCYCTRRDYNPIPSSDPAYASRSGAVVCTVAAGHC